MFALPCRLNLQTCFTPELLMWMALKVWPAFPIVLDFIFLSVLPQLVQAVANVNTVLKHHNRVCKINICNMPDLLLKKFVAMEKPFEALTILNIWSFNDPEDGISFPTAGNLLLSTSDLVDLGLYEL
jgi:hypothetical protein